MLTIMEEKAKVQIALEGTDAQIYKLLRDKKSFFVAMMNMAYNDAVYNGMFFAKDENAPTPKNTNLRTSNGAITEQNNTDFGKKKKVVEESWK